jgi:hypothetical protein
MTRVNLLRPSIATGLGALLALSTLAATSAQTLDPSSLVVTKRDAGSGYVASKAVTSPDSFGRVAACVNGSAPARAVVNDVQGPELANRKTGATIFSSLQVLQTPAMAASDRGIMSSNEFPDCVAQAIADSQAGAQHLTGIRARRVQVKPFGDYSTAVLLEASGTAVGGRPIWVTQIDVGIMKGRAEVNASFTTAGTRPFDRRTAEAILAKLARRLKRAAVR